MVIRRSSLQLRRGWLMAELAIALTLIVLIMIPLGYTFHREHKFSRSLYQRAIATQIVDGEFQFLKAGDWKQLAEGETEIKSKAAAMQNLAGKLIAVKQKSTIRLEWRPLDEPVTSWITREFTLHENTGTR